MNSDLFDKIVKEEIEKLICERLSQRIFHFCPLSACYNIVMSDSLILSSVEQNENDRRMNSFSTGNGGFKTYPYYMCFSRTPSTADGYVRTRRNNTPDWSRVTVRIEFDGDALNANYRGVPVNAFTQGTDPEKLNTGGEYYGVPKNPGLMTNLTRGGSERRAFSNVDKSLWLPMSYEHEDRLLSTERIIKNASRYIKEIDILLRDDLLRNPEKYPSIFAMLGKIMRKHTYGDRIRIYNNEKAFNSLNVRDSYSLEQVYSVSKRAEKRSLANNYSFVNNSDFSKVYSSALRADVNDSIKLSNSLLKNITIILAAVSYNFRNYTGKYKNDTLALAKKCGLGKYLNEIVNYIPEFADWGLMRFQYCAKMLNSTMVQLRTQFPDIHDKIMSLVESEKDKLKVGLFYGKGLVHKKIYGF